MFASFRSIVTEDEDNRQNNKKQSATHLHTAVHVNRRLAVRHSSCEGSRAGSSALITSPRSPFDSDCGNDQNALRVYPCPHPLENLSVRGVVASSASVPQYLCDDSKNPVEVLVKSSDAVHKSAASRRAEQKTTPGKSVIISCSFVTNSLSQKCDAHQQCYPANTTRHEQSHWSTPHYSRKPPCRCATFQRPPQARATLHRQLCTGNSPRTRPRKHAESRPASPGRLLKSP